MTVELKGHESLALLDTGAAESMVSADKLTRNEIEFKESNITVTRAFGTDSYLWAVGKVNIKLKMHELINMEHQSFMVIELSQASSVCDFRRGFLVKS